MHSLAAENRVRRRRTYGLTLVEILIALAIVGLISGMAVAGTGVLEGARLKRSAIMVASAVRIAYAHSSAVSRPVRLVFDFNEQQLTIEEGTQNFLVAKRDRTGGAMAATEAEKAAALEVDEQKKGPRPPRPAFQPAQAFGFRPDEGKTGKSLADGIRFKQVETQHDEEPVTSDRAYLYFWPGGQTERAAIQLRRGAGEEDSTLTVVVHPLTGKAEIQRGNVSMPRPRDAKEESEREDWGQ